MCGVRNLEGQRLCLNDMFVKKGVKFLFVLIIIFLTATLLWGVRKGLQQKENRSNNILKRLFRSLGTVLSQLCNLKSVTSKDLAGIGHSMLFWGFLVFALSYLFIFIGAAWTEDFSQVIFGSLGSQVFSLILEIFALIVIIAVVWAAYRRYVLKPERLEPSPEAGIILAMIFVLMVTLLFQ